jgi:cation/acetate symporter
MLVNFTVAILAASRTAPPPVEIQQLVEEIRLPRLAGPAHEIRA